MLGKRVLMEKMVSYKVLVDMGFPQSQARRIIRMAKEELAKNGYGFYNGRRVGLVPMSAINKILALPNEEEGDQVNGKN